MLHLKSHLELAIFFNMERWRINPVNRGTVSGELLDAAHLKKLALLSPLPPCCFAAKEKAVASQLHPTEFGKYLCISLSHIPLPWRIRQPPPPSLASSAKIQKLVLVSCHVGAFTNQGSSYLPAGWRQTSSFPSTLSETSKAELSL